MTPVRLTRSPPDYADQLARQCAMLKLPPPLREYTFHPTRRWRFDLAWPDARLAVEIEGGIFLGYQRQIPGRHIQPAGYRRDLEKYNAAALLGWRLLRFLPEQIAPGTAVLAVLEALQSDTNGTAVLETFR